MRELTKYSEPIMVGGEPLGDALLAYKMDCTSDQSNMRRDVDLGTCNCCDYFRVENDCVLLIEETRIIDTIKELKSKYDELVGSKRDELVHSVIRNENRQKAYGSLLILCRLAFKNESVSSVIKDKPVKFLLVVSAISDDDAFYFDDLSPKLRNDLKSLLTAKVVADVEILNPGKLKEKLMSLN